MDPSKLSRNKIILAAVFLLFPYPALGQQTPKEKQLKDVTILDVFENAASVKIVASDWIDYLHLARWNGRWVIVNVLWELKPKEK